MTAEQIPEERGEYKSSPTIPAGFEHYLGEEPLTIVEVTNLLPALEAIDSEKAKELRAKLEVLHNLKLTDEGSSRRNVVLMADVDGNRSIVVVCREKNPPEDRNPAYENIKVIGGCGLYPNLTPLQHTDLLRGIMSRKCWMAGLDLGGMKATIPLRSGWGRFKTLQEATGFLFSPKGPFKDAITGTDSGIHPDIIKNMAYGSAIGGDKQIAGTIEALDTPASCALSIQATHEELCRVYKEVPAISNSAVIIEGFGRVGRPTALSMLDKEAKELIIIEPILTNELHLLPKSLQDDPLELEKKRAILAQKLEKLEAQSRRLFGENRIRLIKTTDLRYQEAQIFCPCSNAEALLNNEKISLLHQIGVKEILPAGNNIFGKEEREQRAAYAASLGIIVAPEILSNCGSVTAAAMEPLFRAKQQADPNFTAEQFRDEVVIPHIAQNTRQKLIMLYQIAQDAGTDLYNAAEIAWRKHLQNQQPAPILQLAAI